jgi:hypothetical protein
MYKWNCAPFGFLLFKKRNTDDNTNDLTKGSKIGSNHIKHESFFKNQPLSKNHYNHLIEKEHQALNNPIKQHATREDSSNKVTKKNNHVKHESKKH